MTTIWGSRKILMLAGAVLVSGFAAGGTSGEEIITDDFSTSSVVTETGGTFAPGFSKAGTKWSVESGKVSSGGTPLPYESPAGQLVLDRSQKTRVRIDFGSVANDTPAKVSFQLRQWDGAGPSSAFFFGITLGCKELGAEYSVMMSLSPGYFGTEGGTSGIGVVDSGGAHGGVAEAHFPHSAAGQAFHDITIEFDPSTGISVFIDGEPVAAHKNTDGLPKVDYISLSNEGSPTGGNLGWFIDNFSVEASLTP